MTNIMSTVDTRNLKMLTFTVRKTEYAKIAVSSAFRQPVFIRDSRRFDELKASNFVFFLVSVHKCNCQ